MKRPNGSGNVYKRGSTWTARTVTGWLPSDSATGLKPIWKTKGGFRTKKDALLYLDTLKSASDHAARSFQQNYDAWKNVYESRVSAKTMEGYETAFRWYRSIWTRKISQISVTDLQACVDACPKKRRTRQLMKVVAGLVFKYAMDDDQILRNAAANIYIAPGEAAHYDPLTEEELKKISASNNPYASYIVAMCYLGHRPTEFFSLRKTDYHEEDDICYLTGGIKTDAGKNRAVTIPARVLPIIRAQLLLDTPFLFPRIRRTKDGVVFEQMTKSYFNNFVWKPLMDSLGISGKVPYACRHTYANLIKDAAGAEKDKAGLMGHASYKTTMKHYQSTDLAHLKAITDQLI